MRHYTAYIDEAGDEGLGKLAAGPIGGQSTWLVIGAALVSRENDLKLPALRDRIISRFPKKKTRDLHFRDLKHEQKVVVCQEIGAKPIRACIALSHKVTIPGSSWSNVFKRKGYLYNYLLRYLLERISYACYEAASGEPCTMKIVFSRRGNTDYQTMMDYFLSIKSGNEFKTPVRRIIWNVSDFDQIVVENHSKWAGLQIADCITSAFFSGIEPDTYGNYQHRYAKLLEGRLITRNNQILNCGLIPVPSLAKCALDAEQKEFFDYFKKVEQAPGP